LSFRRDGEEKTRVPEKPARDKAPFTTPCAHLLEGIPVQKEDIPARIGRLVATFPGVEALHDMYGSIPGEEDPFLPKTGKSSLQSVTDVLVMYPSMKDTYVLSDSRYLARA